MESSDLLSTMSNDLTEINFVLKKTSNLGIKGRIFDGSNGIPDIQVDAFSEKGMHHLYTF